MTALRRVPIVGPPLVRAALILRYKRVLGTLPRLNPPLGYNDLMLERLLRDRDPRLRTICDKLAARQFIGERVDPRFLVPLLGSWKEPEEIDWSGLPPRFVLKPNHASGLFALVRSESDRDPVRLASQAQQWLRVDYFDTSLEWGYRDMPRRLLAEPLLIGPDGGAPPELQIMTFGGRAALIRVLEGQKGTPQRRLSWLDITGKRLPWYESDLSPGDFHLSPEPLDEVLAMAERLAAGFSHLRVDIYLTEAGPRIGELTPYHGGGRTPWSSPEIDTTLGLLWRRPESIPPRVPWSAERAVAERLEC